MKKTIEELQKEYDLLQNQFKTSLVYTAFVYGMANEGNKLAIKLVDLYSNELAITEEDFVYQVSVKNKG